MTTSLGKFLRKLRIDHEEILMDMAEKLGVSAPFISSVENGKKNMPTTWVAMLTHQYHLSKDQIAELKKAVEETKTAIKLNLQNSTETQKDLAQCFARSFGNVDEETAKKIKKLLENTARND